MKRQAKQPKLSATRRKASREVIADAIAQARAAGVRTVVIPIPGQLAAAIDQRERELDAEQKRAASKLGGRKPGYRRADSEEMDPTTGLTPSEARLAARRTALLELLRVTGSSRLRTAERLAGKWGVDVETISRYLRDLVKNDDEAQRLDAATRRAHREALEYTDAALPEAGALDRRTRSQAEKRHFTRYREPGKK